MCLSVVERLGGGSVLMKGNAAGQRHNIVASNFKMENNDKATKRSDAKFPSRSRQARDLSVAFYSEFALVKQFSGWCSCSI